MTVVRKITTGEAEMKLTALLEELGLSLSELDALTEACGCCYSISEPIPYSLLAEIEGYRFLLDV